jgi:hypothetical protein
MDRGGSGKLEGFQPGGHNVECVDSSTKPGVDNSGVGHEAISFCGRFFFRDDGCVNGSFPAVKTESAQFAENFGLQPVQELLDTSISDLLQLAAEEGFFRCICGVCNHDRLTIFTKDRAALGIFPHDLFRWGTGAERICQELHTASVCIYRFRFGLDCRTELSLCGDWRHRESFFEGIQHFVKGARGELPIGIKKDFRISGQELHEDAEFRFLGRIWVENGRQPMPEFGPLEVGVLSRKFLHREET